MKNNSKRLAVLRILLTVLLAVFLITPNITEAYTVTVTQGKTKDYTVTATGEEFQVNLENAYTSTSFQGGPSWIDCKGSGSSYTLTAPRNGSGSKREGNVTFRDGDKTWTIHVTQYAAVDLTVSVKFDYNGGSANIGNHTYTVGARYEYLPVGPTPPTGHKFDGWYTAPSGGTRITEYSTVSESYKTLYAQYSLRDYTVSFNSNGGSWVGSKTVRYNNYYGDLPYPSRTYYTFQGWYTDLSGGKRITSSSVFNVAADQTLYAHWTRDTVTVTFNNNGGSGNIGNKTYNVGDRYGSLPAGPTPPKGFTFDGWYTAATGGSKMTADSIAYASYPTLYAHYTANKYTLTYDSQGGSGASPVNVTYGNTYGSVYKSGTLPEPIRGNHTFLGWYTEAEGGSKITPSTKVSIAANHTLYAHWRRNTVSVSFDNNGGSGTIGSRSYGIGIAYGTLPAGPTPKKGYSFDGWYTAASGGNKITENTTVSATLTVLYAHYKANTYTVSFNSMSGTSVSQKPVTYDAKYGTLTSPTRTGYTFQGWYTEKEGGSRITAESKVTIAANHTLYAHWTINQYTVTFNPNNGQAAYSKKLNYGTTLPNPTAWTGHTFGGWYTKPSEGDKVTKVTGTQTVFAHWTINKYAITFEPCHDNLSAYKKELTYGATLPNPSSRTGYTFAGWYTTASGGTKVETVSKQQTVYAHWTVNQYTVTFNPNNGQAAYSKKLNYGTTLPNPATWTGHTFGGWYTKPSGGDKVTKVTGTQTVCAHWTTNKYTITFDPCHDNLSAYKKELTYGATLPNPSSRTGYTFAGWYTTASGGTKVETVSKQQTVYAHWTVNQYTVTFNPNNGQAAYSKKLNYGTTLPNPAAWTGHTFDGWYTKPSGGDKVTKVTGTQTVCAHWTTNKYTITFDPCHDNLSTYTKSLDYGTTLPKPTGRTGYTFDGWYTAASGGTKVETVSKQQKVYAHWTVNQYTVTFNPNNAQSAYSKKLNYGTTLPNPATWTGHTFGGWYTKPSGGDKVTTVTGTQTVFAHWTISKYTITFDVNGTKVTKTLEYNATLPTLEGLDQADKLKTAVKGTQVFVKWVDDKSNECKKVDGVTTSVKAVFETLSVSLKQNGGSGSAKLVNTTQGFILYPGSLKKDGYVITGWNTKSDGTGKSFTMGQQYTAAALIASGETFPTQKSVTLYAVWKKLSKNAITISVMVPAKQDVDLMLPDTGEYTYSIKWSGNGAQSNCDSVVGDISGYSISFETGNVSGKSVVLDSKNYLLKLTNRANSGSCTATVTLKKTGVFVTYDYNHPNHPRYNKPTKLISGIDQAYKLPTMYPGDEEFLGSAGIEPFMNYMRFDGWWTKPGDNQGQRIDNTSKMTSEKDMVLYAHWKKWSPQWDTFLEEVASSSDLDVNKLGITEDMFINFGDYDGSIPMITNAGTLQYVSYVIRTTPPYTSYILVGSTANIPDTHNDTSKDIHVPAKLKTELLVTTKILANSGNLFVYNLSSDIPMIEARVEGGNPDLILTTQECVKKSSSDSSIPEVLFSVYNTGKKMKNLRFPTTWKDFNLLSFMSELYNLSKDNFLNLSVEKTHNINEFKIECNDYQLSAAKKVRAFGINIGSDDHLYKPDHYLQGKIELSWPKDGYFPTSNDSDPEYMQIEYRLIEDESNMRGVKVSFNYTIVDLSSREIYEKECKYSTILRYQ